MTKKRNPSKNGKSNKLSAARLQQVILALFREHPKKRFNPRQIIQILKIENSKDAVQHALESLVGKKMLLPLEDFKFKLRTDAPKGTKGTLYEGYVDMTRSGSAYIVCDRLEEDVFVPASGLNSAMHGDRVRISAWKPRSRFRMEGEVVAVTERATTHFIGTLFLHARYASVVPDTPVPLEIYVDLANLNGAKHEDKVVIKITRYDSGRFTNLEGTVTKVLGKSGSHDIEMQAILINNGFDLDFSEEALAEAHKIQEAILPEEIARRRDMRDILTITIDPFNAKDFDDAISYRQLEDGHTEVGVHIADVSHYLKPGGALDKEAFQRSTSVYLVDRVLPMLPEKLSNELCSLRPEEDKLTFSAVFVFDPKNQITQRWFGKTVTHSNRRYTYEEVQDILDGAEGDYSAELKHLNTIATKLRKDRFKKGSINFDTPEVQFRLDANGAPIEAFVKERKDAHLLIEDFMLLANREVATFIHNKGKDREIPFVYRIHDAPNPEKLEEFALFAHEFGFRMDISSPAAISRSLNALVEAAKTDSALKLLEQPAIRTMSKAAYSTDNIGHYGLAFPYYSHFTSPIRRYSDVLAHRILELNLPKEQYHRVKKDQLEDQCKHISMQERKAMDAERESVKYKQTEFMEKHLGQVFDGIISGMTERGIFVTLTETLCEGMVSFESIGEPFNIINNKLRIKGTRSGKEYKAGDPIRVRVIQTDLRRRTIDMELAQA